MNGKLHASSWVTARPRNDPTAIEPSSKTAKPGSAPFVNPMIGSHIQSKEAPPLPRGHDEATIDELVLAASCLAALAGNGYLEAAQALRDMTEKRLGAVAAEA